MSVSMVRLPAMGRQRQRGSVRRRGNSFGIRVFAGPLTGQDRYVTEATTDPREVERIETRLLAQVDQQRSTPTKASLGRLLDAWLEVHDADQSTLDGYRWLI